MAKPYAVVNFINDDSTVEGESASEVPSCWITDDKKKCWWPTSKNAGLHITRKTVPVKNDKNWQLHDVEVLGFYDDLAHARQKANGLSSGDESQNETGTETVPFKKTILETIKEENVRNKGRKKYIQPKDTNEDYLASDESDIQETTNSIPTPPKLIPERNDEIKIAKDGRSMKPRVISDVPTSITMNKFKNVPIETVQSEGLPSTSRVGEMLNDSNGNCMSLPLYDTSINDLFIDSKAISLQIEALGVGMKDLSQKMAEKMGELMFCMHNIAARLDNIEKAINVNPVTKSHDDFKDLAPLFPLKTVEELKDFENHLTVGDIKIRLVSYLQKVGGNTAKECISRTLKKIFGPELAKKSSWYGLRGNFKVGDLSIMNAVKEAVQQSFTFTDKYFEDEGKEWFRQGGQKFARIQKKIEDPKE